MPIETKIIKKRFKTHLLKLIKRFNNDFPIEERKDFTRQVVEKLFGFSPPTEEGLNLYDLTELPNGTFQISVDKEKAYLIEVVSDISSAQLLVPMPDSDIQNRYLMVTDGIRWNIHEIEEVRNSVHKPIGSLDLTNLDSRAIVFTGIQTKLFAESYTLDRLIESPNLKRWYCYREKVTRETVYQVLVDFVIYEDLTERVHIPILKKTLWGSKPFEARQEANKLIDTYLYANYGEDVEDLEKYETIAFKNETIPIQVANTQLTLPFGA